MNSSGKIASNSWNRFSQLAQKLKTPEGVQAFLKKIPYNEEENGETVHSAYQALRHKKAHCLEAAFIAAAIMEHRGFSPFVVSIESKDGLGHTLFLFKEKGKVGAIARSKEEGLNGRKPVFRSVRDLVWSYYEPYVDDTSEMTDYAVVNLDESGTNWRYSTNNLWKTEKFLVGLKHTALCTDPNRYNKAYNKYIKFGPPAPKDYWW